MISRNVLFQRGWRLYAIGALMSATLGASVAAGPQTPAPPGKPAAPASPYAWSPEKATYPSDLSMYTYYTADQAARGRLLYNRECAYCHQIDQNRSPLGFSLALAPKLLQRATQYGQALFPSVFYLYKRLETMPADDADRISPRERTDITAFLLQINGLPAGDTELPPVKTAMKAMVLPSEPGFVHLFNGRDWKGLKFNIGFDCDPAPRGCGRTQPGSVVAITPDGNISYGGKIQGMIYTDRKYRNWTLRYDVREVDPDWDPADYNHLHQDQGGIAIFSGEDAHIWPRGMLEVQGRSYDLMRFAGGGGPLDADDAARRRFMRPINYWNAIEITVKDKTVTTYLNGEKIAERQQSSLDPGGQYIGLQLEGAPTDWRHIRIKEE
jgi:mono/diheme cytochrome c family protein